MVVVSALPKRVCLRPLSKVSATQQNLRQVCHLGVYEAVNDLIPGNEKVKIVPKQTEVQKKMEGGHTTDYSLHASKG